MIFFASSNGQARLSAAALSISGLRSMLAEPAMTDFRYCLDCLAGNSGFAGNALGKPAPCVNDHSAFSLRGGRRFPRYGVSSEGAGHEETDRARGADLSDGGDLRLRPRHDRRRAEADRRGGEVLADLRGLQSG